jgi:hypothetical protein
LEPSTEFQRKMLSNGSRENTTVLSTTDLYLNISAQSSSISKYSTIRRLDYYNLFCFKSSNLDNCISKS